MLYLVAALLLAAFFPHSTYADQIAISDLPLFSRAGSRVQRCIQIEQSSYIRTYGCTLTNPAPCLCSEASSSYRVASAISDCVDVGVLWTDGRSDYTTATQIFASYCLTNAGISARDETLLQDFPVFTQGPSEVAGCATSISSEYMRSYGCDFYNPAACLCGISQSSFVVQSEMLSCASRRLYNSLSKVSTIAELWSSYCVANLATSATRQLGAVITQSDSAPTGAASSAVPSATASRPTSKTPSAFLDNHANSFAQDTATGTRSASSSSSTVASPPADSSSSGSSSSDSNSPGSSSSGSNSSGSNSSGSGGSGLSVGAQVGLAVGCAVGAAVLTVVATWWKPHQLGRFLTCGTWPSSMANDQKAREQMTQLLTGHWRQAPQDGNV